jgi:hypothetical protein
MRDVVTIGATRCLDPPNVTRFHENTKGRGRLSDGQRNLPHTWVEWSCSQLLQNTPLHPIAEWGRQRFGGADVPPAQRVVAPPFDGRDDEVLRERLKEAKGIGTPATRAEMRLTQYAASPSASSASSRTRGEAIDRVVGLLGDAVETARAGCAP